ncbi:MAG: lema family protein [Xenophilus sp.]
MSRAGDSLLAWAGLAVLLFWFVGAHNRLVRLRSAALKAYGALDAQMARQVDFVQAALAAPATGGPGGTAEAALRAASAQLSTVMGSARLRPLDPLAMAALGTALRVLMTAWQRMHPDQEPISFEADGTLSRPMPLEQPPSAAGIAAPLAWPEPSALAEITRAQFNAAVAQYNHATGQFPAVLVAWALRMRRAAALG